MFGATRQAINFPQKSQTKGNSRSGIQSTKKEEASQDVARICDAFASKYIFIS